MTAARILAGIGLAAMVAALAHGFIAGDFATEGAALLGTPWGRVTLVDVYVGFALFAGWIAFREGRWTAAAGWIVLLMLLGNLIACLYVLIALARSRGEWPRFWLGARAA